MVVVVLSAANMTAAGVASGPERGRVLRNAMLFVDCSGSAINGTEVYKHSHHLVQSKRPRGIANIRLRAMRENNARAVAATCEAGSVHVRKQKCIHDIQ